MAALQGVNIGPLDPDAGSDFGSVAAGNAARQLLRAHMGMYPRDVVRALSIPHHEERTRTLVRSEVEAAIKGSLPRGARVTGFAVHGEDDGPAQFVTFTYEVERKNPLGGPNGLVNGKGAIDYEPEDFPKSHANGDRAIGIRRAREDGLPWSPESGVLDPPKAARRERALRAVEDADGDESELRDELDAEREAREEAERERDDLRAQLAALSERVAAIEGGQVEGVSEEERGDLSGPAGTAEGEDNPAEPWEGYEGANAQDVVRRIRDEKDVDSARLVVAYETKNAHRGTVLAAANSVLDGHNG